MVYEWCMILTGNMLRHSICWEMLKKVYSLVNLGLSLFKNFYKKSKKESFFVLKIYPEKLEKLCVCVIHAFEMTSLIKYHYGHIFFNLYS